MNYTDCRIQKYEKGIDFPMVGWLPGIWSLCYLRFSIHPECTPWRPSFRGPSLAFKCPYHPIFRGVNCSSINLYAWPFPAHIGSRSEKLHRGCNAWARGDGAISVHSSACWLKWTPSGAIYKGHAEQYGWWTEKWTDWHGTSRWQ